MTPRRQFPIDMVLAVLFTLVTMAAALLFAQGQINPHHDGLVLKPAMDILHGAFPYRDTFMMYGLVTTALQVAAVWLGGERLMVIRDLTAVFYGLNAGLLYLIWRRVMPVPAAVMASLALLGLAPFWVMFLPWSSIFAITFQAVMLLALMTWLDRPSVRWAALAGLAAFLVLGSRQPVGIVTTGAALVFFALLVWRRRDMATRHGALAFIAAVAAPTALALSWLSAVGALDHWSRQSAGVMSSVLLQGRELHGAGEWLAFLKQVLSQLNANMLASTDIVLNWINRKFQSPSLIWGGITAVAAVLALRQTLVAVRGRVGLEDSRLLLLALVAVASCVQYFPMPDFMHFYWGGAFGIGLVVLVLWRSFEDTSRLLSTLLTGLILVLLLRHEIVDKRVSQRATPFTAGEMILANRGSGKAKLVRLESPPVVAGMLVTPVEKQFYEGIAAAMVEYAAANPTATLVDLTKEPLLQLFFPRWFPNYHPLFVDYDTFRNEERNFLYPEFDRLRAEHIARVRPLLLSEKPAVAGYRVVYEPPANTLRVWLLAPEEAAKPAPVK